MTPEEFERIKEEEKAHLRKLKELKAAARTLGRQKRVTDVLDRMVSASKDVLSKSEELVDKLLHDTAHQEARLDIALESAAERDAQRKAQEELAQAEEELAKAKARATLEQMKQQLGVPEARPSAAPASVEKTIGAVPKPSAPSATSAPKASSAPVARTSSADTPPADEPLPEKTIGRMRK